MESCFSFPVSSFLLVPGIANPGNAKPQLGFFFFPGNAKPQLGFSSINAELGLQGNRMKTHSIMELCFQDF
jgi:hypothetical protein